jgi:hypothetical protein
MIKTKGYGGLEQLAVLAILAVLVFLGFTGIAKLGSMWGSGNSEYHAERHLADLYEDYTVHGLACDQGSVHGNLFLVACTARIQDPNNSPTETLNLECARGPFNKGCHTALAHGRYD